LLKTIKLVLDLIRGLDVNQEVLLTHGDSINQVADNFKNIGTSGNFIVGQFFIHSIVIHVSNKAIFTNRYCKRKVKVIWIAIPSRS
jgi:hypothetical protein